MLLWQSVSSCSGDGVSVPCQSCRLLCSLCPCCSSRACRCGSAGCTTWCISPLTSWHQPGWSELLPRGEEEGRKKREVKWRDVTRIVTLHTCWCYSINLEFWLFLRGKKWEKTFKDKLYVSCTKDVKIEETNQTLLMARLARVADIDPQCLQPQHTVGYLHAEYLVEFHDILKQRAACSEEAASCLHAGQHCWAHVPARHTGVTTRLLGCM